MIGVSTDYRQQLIAGNRNWVISVPVFLSGNNTNTPDFTLTNAEIWDNGIALDEAISSDSSFDLGAAIVGSLKVVIDNISGNFSSYDFYGAKLTLWLGVEGDEDNGTQRMYRIGFFVVDTPSYNGSLITLNCLDNMTWFDVPFDSVTGITYPANAGTVVQKICDTVGVTLGTPTFPNYSNIHTKVLAKPEQQLNCREMLQYIAQMCCCYCKINTSGQLVLAWYDKNAILNLHDYDGGSFSTTTTPYSDGDDVDGLHFNPWNIGTLYDGGTFDELRDRAFISQNYECDVSTDDVVITGVRVRNNTTKDATKAYDELWVDSTLEPPIGTHERYILVIDNNPLITKAKAGYIANIIGNTLAGLPIRGFSATSLADFSYETGDMATVVDFRGNRYYTWITHFTFTTNNSERFSCGVESIKKRSEQRFSGTVKTLAEANQNAEDKLSAYDTAVKALNDLGNNAINFTEYIYPTTATVVGQSRTVYRYNGNSRTGTASSPKFPYSTAVFKITGDGVFVALAANGDIAADGTCTFSNGYDANSGTAILNTLYAKGVSCSSVKSGRLSLGGSDEGIYKNGELYMYGSDNTEIGHWTRGGISVKTGTITLGGKGAINDNKDGVYIGSDGLELGKGKFKVTDEGQLTAKSGYIGDGSSGWTIGNTEIYNNVTDLSDTTHNGTYVGVSGIKNRNGTNEVKITDGGITANSGQIAQWNINSTGLYSSDAWVEPSKISCGEHGATLVRMQGRTSEGDNSGYLSVEVNKNNDYVHVHTDDITKKSSGGSDAVVWHSQLNQSDKRLKKKIRKLSLKESLAFIKGLIPKEYTFKKEDGRRYGFIAQEVEPLLDDGFATVYEGGDSFKHLHYDDIIAPLVKVVQSQQTEIELLKQELTELKARIK